MGMLGRLLILGRGRGKTGTTTSLVGHDPTEQIARTMAQCGWGSLGRASVLRRASDMGRDRLNTARLKLVSQHSDLRLIADRVLAFKKTILSEELFLGHVLLFYLDLRLFQLVDLLPNHFHFLKLSGY
jgi:hypothetical protein